LNVRDLVFGIQWQINDSPLRKADKRTDEFKRSVGDLGNEISSIGSDGQQSFGKIAQSAKQIKSVVRYDQFQIQR